MELIQRTHRIGLTDPAITDGSGRTPHRSVDVKLASGEVRKFSSFPDFLSELVARGVVAAGEDVLTQREDVIHDVVFEWYRQGQIACQYAVHLALTPAEAKWASEIVHASSSAEQLNLRLD